MKIQWNDVFQKCRSFAKRVIESQLVEDESIERGAIYFDVDQDPPVPFYYRKSDGKRINLRVQNGNPNLN